MEFVFLCALGANLNVLRVQWTSRKKRSPDKKNFKTLEAHTSKTKRSRTKLTRIKHTLNQFSMG